MCMCLASYECFQAALGATVVHCASVYGPRAGRCTQRRNTCDKVLHLSSVCTCAIIRVLPQLRPRIHAWRSSSENGSAEQLWPLAAAGLLTVSRSTHLSLERAQGSLDQTNDQEAKRQQLAGKSPRPSRSSAEEALCKRL